MEGKQQKCDGSGGNGVKTIINYRNGVLVVVEGKQYKCRDGGGG